MKEKSLAVAYMRLTNGVLKPKKLCAPEELETGTLFNLKKVSERHIREYWYWQKVYMSPENWHIMCRKIDKKAKSLIDGLSGESMTISIARSISQHISNPAIFDPVQVRIAVLSYIDEVYVRPKWGIANNVSEDVVGSISEDTVDQLSRQTEAYLLIEALQRYIWSAYHSGGIDEQSPLRVLELINNSDDWQEF